MSPLTKIFVVLHVILSVMLTAGLVVFVNRMENFKKTETTLKSQVNIASARADREAAAAQLAITTAEAAKKDLLGQIDAANGRANGFQTQIGERDVTIAQHLAKITELTAAQTKTAEALKASEDQKKLQAEQLAAARTSVDELTRKNADQSGRISSLTNNLEITESQRKFLDEQLTQIKDELQKARAQVAELGGKTGQEVAEGRVSRSAPPINGVVRGVKTIEGVTYATISVGSADSVTKGMEFSVIDRQAGQFLGTLTIDSVDSNESTGRLDGPKVADVKTGAEVKTQL